MFAEKLGKLMQNMFRGKTKYITVPVAPGAATQQALPPDNLPRHVAIIMAGNGRWAVPVSYKHLADVRSADDCNERFCHVFLHKRAHIARGYTFLL